ncbi:hypothetical protein I0Q12_31220 [Rhodococcus sp. CX]|uniref:hypothetical protein n=1 Tax=Rhodococcus sp. CX TaxID=2789880 RepID=UPI0018CF1A95|nr:hypothetical protein [Rhodococcus sp. CX]MBH0123703.1 hypothetical protein [Rhodococcus sp. CX]
MGAVVATLEDCAPESGCITARVGALGVAGTLDRTVVDTTRTGSTDPESESFVPIIRLPATTDSNATPTPAIHRFVRRPAEASGDASAVTRTGPEPVEADAGGNGLTGLLNDTLELAPLGVVGAAPVVGAALGARSPT